VEKKMDNPKGAAFVVAERILEKPPKSCQKKKERKKTRRRIFHTHPGVNA